MLTAVAITGAIFVASLYVACWIAGVNETPSPRDEDPLNGE